MSGNLFITKVPILTGLIGSSLKIEKISRSINTFSYGGLQLFLFPVYFERFFPFNDFPIKFKIYRYARNRAGEV